MNRPTEYAAGSVWSPEQEQSVWLCVFGGRMDLSGRQTSNLEIPGLRVASFWSGV